jgi:uncharacterized membrane protein YphA (DoxX/SURF4 family)
MFIATLMLNTLLAVVYAMSGSMKLAGQAQSVEIRDHLGVRPTLWRTIGLIEVAAAAALLAGLALAPLGAAAAVGLALLMVGAGIHHHRASDPLNVKAPVAVLFVLAIITVFARLAST